VIWKLPTADCSGGVEIGLYSLDRTLRLLRQVRGQARLLFPRFAIFSESPEDFFHTYWQTKRYYIYRSRRKGNNGQNEAAAIIVFNNSNQK
jgi:hypothetical protein